jgi:hypothetical protein
MPLVRIDLTTGRSPEAVRDIADAIHAAIVDVYGIPPRDRFQIVTQHPAQPIIAEDVENGPEDWSFGFGRAQYFTGELGVPSAG